MKRVYKFLLFLLGILSFGACDDVTPQVQEYGVPQIYNLSGTVKTSEDLAIEGIEVSFGDCSALTDDEGVWNISECLYGVSACSASTCYVTAVDVDGDENGSYQSKSVNFEPVDNEKTDIEIVLTEEEE